MLGGGIAGLTAAGVLARHFEEVTLVERDRYRPSPRCDRTRPTARTFTFFWPVVW